LQYWVIPPKNSGAKNNDGWVAAMENVLETYHLPYDEEIPVVVMDEQPVQLFKEVRQPIAATRHHPKRVDYEYKRAGVATIFMIAQPVGVACRSVNRKQKSTGRTKCESSWKRTSRTRSK